MPTNEGACESTHKRVGDPLHQFTALPPPLLREAQGGFVRALQVAVMLVQALLELHVLEDAIVRQRNMNDND